MRARASILLVGILGVLVTQMGAWSITNPVDGGDHSKFANIAAQGACDEGVSVVAAMVLNGVDHQSGTYATPFLATMWSVDLPVPAGPMQWTVSNLWVLELRAQGTVKKANSVHIVNP